MSAVESVSCGASASAAARRRSKVCSWASHRAAERRAAPAVGRVAEQVEAVAQYEAIFGRNDVAEGFAAIVAARLADEEHPARPSAPPERPAAKGAVEPQVNAHNHRQPAQPRQVLADGVNVLLVAMDKLDAMSANQPGQPPQ
jgi:hypothetical protein